MLSDNLCPKTDVGRKCAGFTIIEMCISLSLGVVVISGTLLGVSHATRWFSHLRRELLAERTFIEVQVVFERAFSALESGRLSQMWQIHKDGAFLFRDTTPHPISRIKGTSQPRIGSDGISILELGPEGIASVKSATLNELSLCPLMTPALRLNQIHSFLHLSLHGVEQRSTGGSTTGIIWPNQCAKVGGSRLRSIFASEQTPHVTGQLAVPITQEYSLYVDRSSHLRLIGHRGGWIRENQPLVDGLRSLRITSHVQAGVTLFAIHMVSNYERTRTWSRPLRIGRNERFVDALL